MNLINIKPILFLVAIISPFLIFSQINENFDNNYSFKNNLWQGDTLKFSIENEELKLNNEPKTDTVLIYKTHSSWQEDSIIWEISIEQLFSASNNNYSLIYLASDSIFENSFYIKIGESGSDDKIKFYHKNSSTVIHESKEDTFGKEFNYNIKVVKSKESYRVYIDKKDGNNYVFDSDFTNNMSLENLNYFGIKCRHTSSNSTKFIFDDISIIYDIYSDKNPPTIDSVIVKSENQLKVCFSEPLHQNPFYSENINSSIFIKKIDSVSKTEYELTFEYNFINFNYNSITINNLYDTLLNNNQNIEINWEIEQYETPNFRSIILNEIIAIPNSTIANEFIEIYNRTDSYYQANSLTLYDKTNYNTLPEFIIKPKQYYILCDIKDTSYFNSFGETIGVENFITLNNSNEELKLIANNIVIDSLNYTITENEKSLAYISANNNCFYNELWLPSEEIFGSSPGSKNHFLEMDNSLEIISVNPKGDSAIDIYLNAIIDTNSLIKVSKQEENIDYTISFNNELKSFQINTVEKLERGVQIQFKIDSINTCYQEITSINFNIMLPYIPSEKDLIITEILSNTNDQQFDYIEITNNSDKFFSLNDIYINKINSDATIITSKLSDSNIIIHPNNHYVFSKNTSWFIDYYNNVNEEFLFTANLPSLNNDSNTVFISNKEKVIDLVSYNNNWHFELVTNEKGVSLEKIDYQNNENNSSNWTSSASSNNFGSPTNENSHFNNHKKNKESNFSLESSIFSPDNDGYQDLLAINYLFSENNNIITAIIYNENGSLIKELVTNETLASNGTITWNGINENNTITPAGFYIIIIEKFNLNGAYTIEKIPFVIAKYL